MTTPLTFQAVPLAQLHVSAANMRHGKDAPDTSDILPSIRERGVLQPLLVRDEPDADGEALYGIVAGRRRYHALCQLEQDAHPVGNVPCVFIGANDDVAALEASLLENVARLDATEVEQFRTFAALAKQGRQVADIAATFGVSEMFVRRRLALGNLRPAILKGFEAGEISAGTLRALTLATKRQQDGWLRLFRAEDAHTPTGDTLRGWLVGSDVITTDVAMFDLATFKGRILRDLFGDADQFADVDAFWEAQNVAIAELADAYKADGWSDVAIVEGYFGTWELRKLPKAAGGRVYINVRAHGEVTTHEGYVTEREFKRYQTAKAKADAEARGETVSVPAKPEMTGPLVEYFDLHRHSIARLGLLYHSGLALRLVATHILCGSRHWQVGPDLRRARKAATCASAAASPAEAELATARDAIAAELGFAIEPAEWGQGFAAPPAADVLSILLDKPDAFVMRLLTVLMAETLAVGDALVEAVGTLTGVEAGRYWCPDDAFFDILRDKRVINAMLGEVGGRALADSVVSESGTKQKAALRNNVDGTTGRAGATQWRPRWLGFPARAYLAEADCPLAVRARDVAHLANAT